MKQFLRTAFFATSIFVATKSINAQCSLDQVGAPNYSTTCILSDMAVSPTSNVLYTISYNTGAGGKFFLHSATTSSSWTPVAQLSGSTSIKPIISVSKTGKVYIVIKDDNAGQVGKVFYESAGSFVQLGTAFSGANKVSDLSIAFNSLGEEYVAYTDNTNGNMATVKKWNGSAWVAVGTGTVSSGAAYYNSLIIDKTDSPVLAFEDMSAGNKVNVIKYNGATWNSIASFGTNPTNTKLKLGQNGDYYVGYTESTGNVVVQKYTGSWAPLGSPVSAMSFTANTFDLDLDPNDVPYFISQNNTSYYAVAFKYTGVPTWSNVIGGNISSVTSLNLNVGIDKTGNPYFFYVDQPINNGLNVKTISSPISISTQPVSITRCNGQSGSFSVGTVGGAPTSYQWQTLGAGTYTNSSAPYTNVTTANLGFTANSSMNQNQVRCVVNVGCKNIISNTSTLTVVTTSSNLVPTNPTCFGSCNGMITSTPSGGTGPYSFTWTPGGASTQNLSGACSGTYSLTTADINGCTVTATGIITDPSPVTSSISGNMTICNGSSTTLTVTATGGTGPYTYNWTPGGSLSSTTTSVVIASPTSTQTYTVTATDALGCVATYTVMVTVNAIPVVSTVNSTICVGSSATLNATGTAHTYTWNPGNLVGAVQNVNPVSNTTYTVVATNTLSGCTNSATALVTVNSLPTVNAGPSRTLTCVSTTTTLAGSSTGGVTFSWTGPGIVSGGTTLSPTINAPGTYDLTVTSSAGCVAGPSPVTVFQDITPPSPTASSGGLLTCATTTIALTGGPATGVTYQWSGPGFSGGTTSQNAAANAAGTFTLLATGLTNGCTNTATTSVSQNTVLPSPTATTSGTLTCSTTTVALSGTPGTGVSYLWTGPGVSGSTTTQNTAANAAGTYTLKVTSSINGCTNTAVTSVTQNTTLPSPTASNGGTLTCTTTTVMLSGGPASGVTYLWSGPGVSGSTTTQNTSANAPGVYTLSVVSSSNGCSSSATTAVTQNITPPTASATNSGTLTCSTTTMNLSGTGGGTYVWSGPSILSGGATTSPVINAPGCYTVVVTAANGCTATANTCVSQNTVAPATTTNVSGTLNCTLTSVNASASTTTTPVSFAWTGSGITSATNISTITVNAGGVKNYTVTNTSNGCITTGSLNVSQNILSPSPTASSTGTITCITNTIQLSGTPAAGVTYTWTAPGGSSIVSGTNSQNAIGNGAGTYTLTVKMISSACINSATVAVNQNTVIPTANAGLDQSLTCASPTVTLNGSATPSTCTPVWTGGVASGTNSFTATATSVGNYTLSVTNPANGCTATDVVQVTANAGIPPLSTSVTNTLDCANTTATVVATTTVTTVTYLWAGTGIVSGGTTANATVNQPGTYSVTVTNTMTGCFATSNVSVNQDITLPNITITSSPSVICSGNSSTLTANGAVSYTWSTAQNTSSISVSPSSTNSYTVNGTGLNGCTNYTVETITVNTTPTLAITGNTNICKGSTTLLTGSGATSYTWDSGVNTTTVSVTPTVTTTYTLTGDNGNGCSSILPITVSIIPNKSITGVITSTNGATGGDIIIYKYTAALSHWDSLTITPIGGTYSFNNIDSGQYVLRAMPTATNIQVTYAPNSISWQGASIINHGCTNNTSQNIDLIGFAPYVVGPGILTGHIEETFGYVPKMSNESKPMVPGTPIGGIIVKGGKNPGGQMFVQTITDAAGNYTLTGLPINTLPDDYFIFVDIPGLDTNSTYYHISVTGSTPITGFDFNVDAEYINPIGSITGMTNDISVLDNKITLFPNPAKQSAFIQYELTKSANVQIELYDIVGNKVKTISENVLEEKDKHTHSINIDNLSSGIYFVKLNINNSLTTMKLIVN